MMYLGIDLHQDQITVNSRNEEGIIVYKGQISTRHDSINDFFSKYASDAKKYGGFMAILEVCGFHWWLYKALVQFKCDEIVLVQPEKSSNKKTDKRDANTLSEYLWNNRFHLRNGNKPVGVRRVYQPSCEECEIRQLVKLKNYLTRQRSTTITKVRGLLRKHNFVQDAPSQDFKTKKVRAWLHKVQLSEVDRFELNVLLDQWDLYDQQILETDAKLIKKGEANPKVHHLDTIPGITVMGAIAILARINDIGRFKTPDSLANYFGLTPGCRNSGKSTQKIGGITKAGSSDARNVLNFAIVQLLRNDPQMRLWHKKIKRRKGAKTARVAVMRKLATIIWHMLKWDLPYQFHYDPPQPVKNKRSKSANTKSGGRKRPQVLKA